MLEFFQIKRHAESPAPLHVPLVVTVPCKHANAQFLAFLGFAFVGSLMRTHIVLKGDDLKIIQYRVIWDPLEVTGVRHHDVEASSPLEPWDWVAEAPDLVRQSHVSHGTCIFVDTEHHWQCFCGTSRTSQKAHERPSFSYSLCLSGRRPGWCFTVTLTVEVSRSRLS